ncbi:MAG: OmpA family protein [Pseudomonadota bacterium]
MKANHILCLAAAGLLTAGCAVESGSKPNQGFGFAARSNDRIQVAYGDPSQRLRDLSVAFRAAVPDTVNFAFDSSRLDSESRRVLDQQAMWLKANKAVRMAVIGHTDLVGGERYNSRLGLRRARVAVNYLVRKGVARSRLDAVESRGESEPVVNTQERERQNRRSVTAVVGFDRQFVGTGLDGIYAERALANYRTLQNAALVPAAAGLAEAVDTADTGG